MILKLIYLCIIMCFSVPVLAQEVHSFDIFKRIPVLDQGRLKPLDTYARNLLIQISSKDTLNNKSAAQWFAILLFKPEALKDEKLFLINSPDIPNAMDISPEHNRRYSFAQLQSQYKKLLPLYQSAIEIPPKEQSIVEAEVIRVFDNLRTFARLSHEIQFAFPNDDFNIKNTQTASSLGLNKTGTYTFLDIAFTAEKIQMMTEDLAIKSEKEWSFQQKEVLGLLNNLFQWSVNYRDLGLNIIPSSHQMDTWNPAWDAIRVDFKHTSIRRMLNSWQDMARAYNAGQQIEFDASTKNFLSEIPALVSKKTKKTISKFDLEIMINTWRPFFIAKICYIFAFIFLIISFMNTSIVWYRLAWGVVILGFIPHALAIILRCVIMMRPPVTNLYETFIFVSLITVILGILIEWVNKRWLGIAVVSISSTALLFVASKYSAEGDTLNMLVAVLNSNFWLGTHVLTITMGYGATCVAGVIGHLWLIHRITKPSDITSLNNTHRILMGMLGLALTLTFLGTNLGGIWADQSWGRFWGWDPKENGALMIVLWTAMLFHAKISGMIKQVGMAVGAVIGMMVVMWAWFGVNLLSIGLHSYGFTTGIAKSLIIYAILEVCFLLIVIFMVKKR